MQGLPAVPGARFAIVSTDGAGNGGTEWADRIVLDDGRLAVVLGRLPSTSPPERRALLAERLRGAVATSVLRAYERAVDVLADLHRFTRHESDLRGATLCVTLLDPGAGRLDCVTAGRPGPWIVDGTGGMCQLLGTRGGPLGAENDNGVVESAGGAHRLAAGETVVLYGADSTDTAMALADLVRSRSASAPDGPADLDALCADLDAVFNKSASDGDRRTATLLAFTRVPRVGDALDLELPADPAQLPRIRQDFAQWLHSVGCPAGPADRLVLALNEAVTNAVEHAYSGLPADTVRVVGEVEQDRSIRVTVSDHGRWQVPGAEEPFRGRGLLMMQESVDRMTIERVSGGTTVRLWVRPHGVDTEARSAEPSPATDSYTLDVRVDGDLATVVVRGDVPEWAAASLRRGLLTASRGAALRLVVDLSGTGSEVAGAVRALFDVAAAAEGTGERLIVFAPHGSHVRELAEMSSLHQVVEFTDGSPSRGATASVKEPAYEKGV
ncbi:MAG: SpoIIE family protein phosphatase [Pseudonocardiaceae bacterium]|nr:SpoIIE family protein phosphatase [Pseudonocardiaceae bacterium]